MSGDVFQSRRDEAIALLERGLSLWQDATSDPHETPAHELELFDRLTSAGDRLTVQVAVTAADVDRRRICETVTGLPLSTRMMSKNRATKGQAFKVMFTGHALESHPEVKDAVVTGKVSKDQAVVITGMLDALPRRLTVEQNSLAGAFLVEKAKTNNSTQLRKLASEALDVADPPDSGADAVMREAARLEAQRERAVRQRGFRYRYEDGSLHFNGQVPAVDGAELVRLVEGQIAADKRNDRTTSQQVSPEQRAADAFLTIIRRPGSAKVAGDRARLVVIMHEDSLARRVEQAGLLPTGEKIPAGDLRRIACDANITPVVLGSHSEVLDVGRTRRLVTDPIRLALSIRDKGCTFPGCTAPDWACSAHHTIPWWAGGNTSIRELVLLCDYGP